ncbi:SDR family oxidoreductase [Maritalea sp.]|uniref:SDR family oxidoreductase n=1 Tax=Maritalea sp. TaxID=2003361 RepID=UPI003EF6E281
MSYKVAIFNANSAQAAPVAYKAAKMGLDVRAIVRNKDKAQPNQNLEFFSADLLDKSQVANALTGVDAAFLHLPVPTDAAHQEIWLQNFISAAHETKLPLLVFSTSGPAGDDYASTPMIDGVTATVKAIQSSGLNVVILQPTVYLENLFVPPFVPRLHDEGILTYPPMPATHKIPFVSHKDQATIAVAALQRPDLAGQSFKIASPNPLTGPELAKALSGWIGQEVEFNPQSPDEFGSHIGQLFGSADIGDGLAGLYRSLISAGENAANIQTDKLEEIFDVKLTSIEQHIAAWPKP